MVANDRMSGPTKAATAMDAAAYGRARRMQTSALSCDSWPCVPAVTRAGSAATNGRRLGRRPHFHPPQTKRIQMLTKAFPFLLPRSIERGLPTRLRSLTADLEQVRGGAAPCSDLLADAPLIADWRVTLTPVGLRLIGFVAGHPLLGNRPGKTSQLWAAADDGSPGSGCCRGFTRSGFSANRDSVDLLRGPGRDDAALGGCHE
jgi:hypothetical protein